MKNALQIQNFFTSAKLKLEMEYNVGPIERWWKRHLDAKDTHYKYHLLHGEWDLLQKD